MKILLNLCCPPPLGQKSVIEFGKRVSQTRLPIFAKNRETRLRNAFPDLLAKGEGQHKFNKFGGKANPTNLLNLCWPPPWPKNRETRFANAFPDFWQKSVNAFGKRVPKRDYRFLAKGGANTSLGGFSNFNSLLNLLNLLNLLKLYWGGQYKFNKFNKLGPP